MIHFKNHEINISQHVIFKENYFPIILLLKIIKILIVYLFYLHYATFIVATG